LVLLGKSITRASTRNQSHGHAEEEQEEENKKKTQKKKKKKMDAVDTCPDRALD
jgi:hypothetical protein